VIYLNIEAKKLADVDFNVDKGVDQVRFVWKKGKLFISLSSIFLNSKMCGMKFQLIILKILKLERIIKLYI
jgi:hypothetical protein